MTLRILIVILICVVGFILEAGADIIYLKNGRSIEGLIKKENQENIEMDVGFGTVKFRRDEIESIKRSGADNAKAIEEEWKAQRKKEKDKWKKAEQEKEEARRRKELEPKETTFSGDGERIVVDALLNKKVNARFLLDTGATTIVLAEGIAKKLGINTKVARKDIITVKVADGRDVDAMHVVLDSVNIQGVEANNVDAVVILAAQENIEDGLLGMSFLGKFNFQIDNKNKKLILQKLE